MTWGEVFEEALMVLIFVILATMAFMTLDYCHELDETNRKAMQEIPVHNDR